MRFSGPYRPVFSNNWRHCRDFSSCLPSLENDKEIRKWLKDWNEKLNYELRIFKDKT